MAYLTIAQYPAIRAALDISLTTAKLPDAVIASAPFHPAAEAEVSRRLGSVAGAAEGQPGAQRAVILLTAARLLGSVPNIIRRTLGDTTIQYKPAEILERQRWFRAEASTEITALVQTLDPNAVTQQPTVFTLAPGNRGGLYESNGTTEGAHIPRFP